MNKGKLGINRTTYCVVAFLLAIFGQMLLCGLVLGYVLITERDEKTTRQCMTAFFLTFANGIIAACGVALVALGAVISGVSFGRGIGVMGVFTLLIGLAYVLVVVFEIIGLVNVAKGREANVPIFSSLAYRAFGYVKQAQPQQPPPYNYPQQPPAYGQQPPAGQPYPPQGGQPYPPAGSPYQGPQGGGAQPSSAPPPPPPPPAGGGQ